MAGLSVSKSDEFLVMQGYINAKIMGVYTTFVGSILSVTEDIAVVSIFNQITTQDQYGKTNSMPIGNITTKFSSSPVFKYCPSIGDKVKLTVSCSDIQNFLNGTSNSLTLSKFNIYDSIIEPIYLGYTDQTKIEAGLINKGFVINCSNFSVNNSSASLIPTLINALQAIAAIVPVPGTPLDTSAGGAITTAVTALQTFLPAIILKEEENKSCSTQATLKQKTKTEIIEELKSVSLMAKLRRVINWNWLGKK